MSKPTDRFALKSSFRAVALILVICAAVALAGCTPLPAGQTPSPITVTARPTLLTSGTAAPATPRSSPTPRPPATAAQPAASSPQTASTGLEAASCQPTDDPQVAVMDVTEAGSGQLPVVCISGLRRIPKLISC